LIEWHSCLVQYSAVRIRFFAQLREVTGVDTGEIDGDGLDAAALWARLENRWPRLSVHRNTTRLARNGTYAGTEEVFVADDEVALIPPVSGG